jgi:hypothetical protein
VQKYSGRYPTALRHNAQQLAGMRHDRSGARSATAAAGPRERKVPCARHEGVLPTAAQAETGRRCSHEPDPVDTDAQITQSLLEGAGGDRLELEDDCGGVKSPKNEGARSVHQHGRALLGGRD